MSCERLEVSSVGGPSGRGQEPSAWAEATDKCVNSTNVHVSAHELAVVPVAPEDVAPHEVSAHPEEGRVGHAIGVGGP